MTTYVQFKNGIPHYSQYREQPDINEQIQYQVRNQNLHSEINNYNLNLANSDNLL